MTNEDQLREKLKQLLPKPFPHELQLKMENLKYKTDNPFERVYFLNRKKKITSSYWKYARYSKRRRYYFEWSDLWDDGDDDNEFFKTPEDCAEYYKLENERESCFRIRIDDFENAKETLFSIIEETIDSVLPKTAIM